MKWLFKLLRIDAYLLIRDNGKTVKFNWKMNGINLVAWLVHIISYVTEGTDATPTDVLLEVQRQIEKNKKEKDMKDYTENQALIEELRSQHPIN